jgi:N4-gp56 family major capsid protein
MAIGGIVTQGNISAIAQGVNPDLHPFLDVYSVEALHHARGVMMYEAFANRRIDLSAAPGQTVKFVTYNDLTRGAELTEGNPLTKQGIGSSVKSITVSEYGNAISLSEKALQLSFDELMSEAAILLGRDYALTRDLYIRDALTTDIVNVKFGGNQNALADVGTGAGGDIFDVDALHEAVLQLQLANTPKFNNDYYVCFLHPKQASSLRRDQDWINAHIYKDQDRALFRGEIGRYEDVIFIASTNQGNGAAGVNDAGYEAALDEAVGANGLAADLYRATLLGDQTYAIADSLPVELRDNGVEDFGREHSLAWYAIWGCGVLNPDHGCHIITA